MQTIAIYKHEVMKMTPILTKILIFASKNLKTYIRSYKRKRIAYMDFRERTYISTYKKTYIVYTYVRM